MIFKEMSVVQRTLWLRPVFVAECNTGLVVLEASLLQLSCLDAVLRGDLGASNSALAFGSVGLGSLDTSLLRRLGLGGSEAHGDVCS